MVAVRGGMRPVHPGAFFGRRVLEPSEFDISGAAKEMGLPVRSLRGFINGDAPVTPEMAGVLAKFTGTEAQFWLNMQANFDVASAEVARASAA